MLYLKEANWEDIEKEYEYITNLAEDENGFTNADYGVSRAEFEDTVLPKYINYSKGIDLPEGFVPETDFFLWKDDTIIGLFRIRHELNDFLRKGPGHIGYGIHKKYRGKGYATEGLRLAIEKAWEIIKEDEIYMSVHKDNLASLQVQKKNGAYIHHEDELEFYTRIKMKTLYVSDLDGTLLRSDETTSDYTNQIINSLIDEGMIFSYATARSFHTSHKVTKGLNAKIPLIIYNGAMVVDNNDGSFLIKNFFGEDVKCVMEDLFQNNIYPITYAFIDGEEKFSYIREKCTEGMKQFVDSRKNDKRDHPVQEETDLCKGEMFYITCIDEKEKLEPLYNKYKDKYHCVFQVDIYTDYQWLEIMPKTASKANAIKQLKEQLRCDKLVVFGDGKNDIDMFELADEAYAVENAVDELKAIATEVIGSNNDDGVAKWLSENSGFGSVK